MKFILTDWLAQLLEHRQPEGHESSHDKDFQNGTWCLLLGAQHKGPEQGNSICQACAPFRTTARPQKFHCIALLASGVVMGEEEVGT